MRKVFPIGCLLLAAACVAFSGCGPAAPADMPETVPFTVKVISLDGKPVADAQIVMTNQDSKAPGAVAGTTNASGVATITTTHKNFTAKGAPVGEYRVQVVKNPQAEHWKTQDEIAMMDLGERAAYMEEWEAKSNELPREVPAEWCSFDGTPLTASVTSGGSVEYNAQTDGAE